MSGSEVTVLTFGLIAGDADVLVDIYIRTEDSYPEQLVIVQPDTVTENEPDPTTWTVELYDYNSDEFVIDTPTDVIEPPPTPTPEPTEEGGLPDAPGS